MSNVDTLLIELGTEELPPKALKKLGQAFAEGVIQGLKNADLGFSDFQWFAAPRRLAIKINELQVKQADRTVERKGPAVKAAYDKDGNPTKAALGFAKSCGVDISELSTQETEKGAWLIFNSEQKGQETKELLPEIIQQSLNKLPIPKRMTWGNHKVAFVRPTHWLVVLLGNQVVDCELLDQKAGNKTRGHRFHASKDIELAHANDYESALKDQGFVNPDYASRREDIKQQVLATAAKYKAQAELDEDLLDEVTGLVEWPVALSGEFDKEFLEVPSEALISAMKEHQKYFPLLDSNNQLVNRFITLSNIESTDPQKVIEGNEKVIRPRLADAAFFFNTDKKQPLEAFNERLKKVVFQKQLGTVYEKVERVATLAEHIATAINGDPTKAKRAAILAKADLATEMVGEFPDLQGTMGKYYAQVGNEDAEVALAIEEQYKPKSAGDSLPETLTGTALSLAEKFDTLVGIFGINQKPTGDKDPFALRRAALGILNILISKSFSLELTPILAKASSLYGDKLSNENVVSDVSKFFLDRYRAFFQSDNVATEVIMSVEALGPDSPLDFAQRIDAVKNFQTLEGADALASANKRVANILKKSDSKDLSLEINKSLLSEEQEKVLVSALESVQTKTADNASNKQYTELLTELASLKDPIDNFFDNVMVNADDPEIKKNRLAILNVIKSQFLQVADVSLLSRD